MNNVLKLRNVVVYALIASMLAWAGALTAFATPASAAAPGDVVKAEGAALYFIGSDSKRYVFANQDVYNSWYKDFSNVKTISQSELSSYPLGGNVAVRPGVRLVQFVTNETPFQVDDPSVYAVADGGVLMHIASAQIASDLYGSAWESRITPQVNTLFANYSVGSQLSSATYPSGSIVQMSGDSTIYRIKDGNKHAFADMAAFDANNYSSSHISVTSMDLASYSSGGSISGYDADIATAAGPGVTGSTSTSVGTLSVALASDTPAATTVVGNAARVGFTKVNFTATGGDVVIDSLVVERAGLSADANFTDLILLDVSNGTSVAKASQVGNEKSLGSTHKVTFNEDIAVMNGTTKSILIAGNMASGLNAGELANLKLTEVNLGGSATMTGSLPVAGNEMTMNASLTIGTLTVANGGANPSATTQAVGTENLIVTSVKLTAGSAEDMHVHGIRFYQNGTAAMEDVKNLELLKDGSVIATVAQPTSKYVDFWFSTPIEITKGNNKDFDLRLDIADGSSRTISFDIEDKIDVIAQGETYGFFRIPTYPNSNSPYFNANNTTIDNGSISFSKGVVANLDVAEGSSDQVLGAFKATVQGEAIQVTQFVVGITVSGTGNAQDITNVTVKDENGNIVAGPVDPGSSANAATTTDTILFPVGTNTYTVHGDLNSDFATNDTVALRLSDPDGLVTAKGDTTNQTITANPTSDLSLDTVTVKGGVLNASVSGTPAAQTVVIGNSGFTFANFVLSAAGSGEDVRVTQFNIPHTTDADSSREDHIANLTLWDGSTQLFPVVQPSNSSGATAATSTFSLSNPIVIAKGSSKTITVKGDLVGGAADDTHAFGLNGSSLTVVGDDTGNSITPAVTAGAGSTMTLADSGSVTIATDAANPNADLLVGGASKVTVGEVLFTASNEDIDLTRLHVDATAVNGGALSDEFAMVYLYDGATMVASGSATSSTAITFEGIPSGTFSIPEGSSGKTLTIKVDTAAVTNQGGDGNVGDSGDGVSLSIAQDAYAFTGRESGSSIGVASMSGTFTGNAFTIYKSIPTFTKLALSSNTLFDSSGVPLFKFKLTADAKGDVGFYKAAFAVSTSGATVTNFEMYEEPGTSGEVNLTSDGARAYSSMLTLNTESAVDILFDTGSDGTAAGGEFRFIPAGTSKTFEFRGKVTGASSGNSVTTVLRGDKAFSAAYPGAAGTIDAEAETDHFIWSDLAYGNSSSTATNTIEWFNGYRVPGLSSTTTSDTLTK